MTFLEIIAGFVMIAIAVAIVNELTLEFRRPKRPPPRILPMSDEDRKHWLDR